MLVFWKRSAGKRAFVPSQDRSGNRVHELYQNRPTADVRAEKPLETSDSGDLSLVEAVAERSGLQNQLYVRYRRPLLQVFLHRRIARDAAEDLLQRTFLQAIKKIRTEGLDDPSNLGGYLYRTACKLATAYWRGELSRRHDNDRELLSNLKDEALVPGGATRSRATREVRSRAHGASARAARPRSVGTVLPP